MDLHTTTETEGETIILVGNPNVGKSVLFNLLTKRYVTVSNYPGTTVELTRGRASFDDKLEVIDTPGANTLTPDSEDEKVTRDILFSSQPKAVIQVIDAKNLARGLNLTLQLSELGKPLIIDLNMLDEASSRGITIDSKKLGEVIGAPVVETVAIQKKGIGELIKQIDKPCIPRLSVQYPDEIEEAVKNISGEVATSSYANRGSALMILSGDEEVIKKIKPQLNKKQYTRIREIIKATNSKYSKPLSQVIHEARSKKADSIISEVFTDEGKPGLTFTQKAGDITMDPFFGIPILLLVLLATYKFVGEFGAGTLVDFLESTVFSEYINPASTRIVYYLTSTPLIREFMVGEYGVITMALSYGIAIILPIVGTFFIVFSLLEDSGYLPRLAVMLDKAFGLMGLNGKAVLPMILGLGCDTMATMTTRILDSRKERIQVTLLLALGVPCSAQLGVIRGMMGSLGGGYTILWASVVGAVMISVGYISSKIIPGDKSDFIVEIPPMRVPRIGNIISKTLARIEWYLREVIPLFILGTAVLFAMDKTGALTIIEKAAKPVVVGFLGLPAQATGAFLIGFMRRDYGAAGLYVLARQGLMSDVQILVSLVTITLFVPCIANVFMIIKEQGWKTAVLMTAFIFPFAFLVGGLLNQVLQVVV